MNTAKFLDLYKELELKVRSVYNLQNSESISYFLSHNEDFVEYEDEIRYMSDIRNIVSHNPKIDGEYAIDVSDKCLEFLQMLIDKIEDRKTLKDVMIPLNKIHFAYDTSLVKDVIGSLSDKIYSHVPVKKDNKIIGVLDEISLFNMIKDGITFDDTLRFTDIEKYTDINRDNSVVYLNAKENTYVDELKTTFTKLYKKGKRVGLVFVYDANNNLLGLLSTTDILGK